MCGRDGNPVHAVCRETESTLDVVLADRGFSDDGDGLWKGCTKEVFAGFEFAVRTNFREFWMIPVAEVPDCEHIVEPFEKEAEM